MISQILLPTEWRTYVLLVLHSTFQSSTWARKIPKLKGFVTEVRTNIEISLDSFYTLTK